MLRTQDGGTTWQRRLTPAGDSLQFRDVYAVDADTAWVLSIGNGTASRIYRTSDGGSTWALQFINRDSAAFYDCLSFGTAAEGIVFGDAAAGARISCAPPTVEVPGHCFRSALCRRHCPVRARLPRVVFA